MTGRKLLVICFGICLIVSAHWTVNKFEFVNQLFQVHYDTTKIDSSVWFCWPFVTHDIVFSFMNIGEYGSDNDCRILKNSRMSKMFDKNKVNIPELEVIPGDDMELRCTAWKVSVFGVLLVRIFPHSAKYGKILRISPNSV